MMTNDEIKYDYIVIGAGSAGLSFAALMEKKGHRVCVLEAHSLPGGCSSYFERDGYTFDAGATTLSGLKTNRPIEKLIRELDLKLELKEVDPGIVSILPGKTIYRYKDSMAWLKELKTKFPAINHEIFWKNINDIEKVGWNLTTTFKNIPLRSFKSIPAFFSMEIFKALKALPSLFKSVGSELDKLNICDPEYLAMIDEMLFITAQNNRTDTPLLMGAMGLSYPDDTYYAIGGMKKFVHSIADNCSNIFYKHEVKNIKPIDAGRDGFEVLTNKGNFKAKKLISTIPIWNLAKIFEDKKVVSFFNSYKTPAPEDCWSAFMIYLTIPQDPTRKSLYYQIHTAAIPHCDTHSFFVSLSHCDDHERSINGRQVVTISTHTKMQDWEGIDKENYKKKKEECADFILEKFKKTFQLQDTDLENIMSGSPKTFVKFTRRYGGLVGGIPHSLKRNPLDYLVAKSPLENFYMLGDTHFPGQGIAAVVLGSQNLVNYLTN